MMKRLEIYHALIWGLVNHSQLTVVLVIDFGSAWKGESTSRPVSSKSPEKAETEKAREAKNRSSMSLPNLISPIVAYKYVLKQVENYAISSQLQLSARHQKKTTTAASLYLRAAGKL
jgi:hypothetical protein